MSHCPAFSADKFDFVKSCGASHVIDYKSDVTAQIMAITEGRGVEYAIDCAGPDSATKGRAVATSGGDVCLCVCLWCVRCGSGVCVSVCVSSVDLCVNLCRCVCVSVSLCFCVLTCTPR